MARGKWLRSAAIAGVIVMLTTGCSVLGIGNQKGEIDPPPAGSIEEATANLPDLDVPVQSGNQNDLEIPVPSDEELEQDAAVQNMEVRTIYALDAHGLVAPVTLQVPKSEALAKTVMEHMVAGGPGEEQLPEGFTALLPQGTKINSINIDKNKLAVIDFSSDLLNYSEENERKVLEGITWAMTTFATVDQVQLRVDGKDLKEMPKLGTPLDEPLSRAIGINIEKQANVDFGQSTPVTLYFMNRDHADYHYYVPVTRLISRTDDVAQAVMDQLIEGPNQNRSLISTLDKSTRVLNLKPSGDLITVNLSAELLNKEMKAPSDALKSVILSLTENTGTSKVQIMIDGKLSFATTDSQNYAEPVSRPVHLNPIKM